MKLKHHMLIAAWLLFLSAIATGCSDWLDYQPKDKQSEEQIFATKEGFYTTVNGIYTRMGTNSLYGKDLSYEFVDIIGQRYTVTQTDEDSYSRYLRALTQWNYSEEGVASTISSIWQEAYSTIMNINVILSNIEADATGKRVLPTQEYQMLKGEMLAARAMIHFDMLRLFGPVYARNPEGRGIPYNESTETKILPILPASTVLDNYILRDLKEAEALLKESDPVQTEGPRAEYDDANNDNSMRYRQLRLNYYAVVLLAARAYLWKADYEHALAEARKLTDDPRVRNFFPPVDPGKLLGNTVNPDRMFSSECLFGLYAKNRNLIYDQTFGGANTGRNLLIPRKGYLGELFNGTDNGDYRLQSQWENGTTLDGEASMKLTKFKGSTMASGNSTATDEELLKTRDFSDSFSSLIKLSEAYYIAAEALGTNGSPVYDATAAFEYLNRMRTWRGIPEKAGGNITDLITREYIREYVGEGQVFFYFKRLNKGFDDPYNGCQKFGPLPPFIVADGASNAEKERRFVVPLPENELNNR